MKRVKLAKFVYTCFQSIPMIFIIFFFLSYLVSKHHKLLSSSYELIVVAKSSRVAVFAVLNVIVISIFLGSSKPSAADFDGMFLSSTSVYEAYGETENEYNEDYDSYGDEECAEPHRYDGYDEDNDDDDDDDEDVDSEDDSDIDLKLRVEEFIASVYKKWREESLAERLLCLEPPS